MKLELVRDGCMAARLGVRLSENYFKKKGELLEQAMFLQLDKLWLGTSQTAELLEEDESIILSRRRQPGMLHEQLRSLGLSRFIDKAFAIQGDKAEWVRERYPDCRKTVIGDSHADLQIGKLAHTRCLMVGCGLESKERLSTVGVPFMFFDSLDSCRLYLSTSPERTG